MVFYFSNENLFMLVRNWDFFNMLRITLRILKD